jgi:hypothetical protein
MLAAGRPKSDGADTRIPGTASTITLIWPQKQAP